MNELRERFRTLDTLEVPDVLSRARSIGPRSPDPEPTPRVRRIGAYVLAAVIATLAVIAIARALDQPGRPADDPMPTPTPASLGSLAYAVDGDIYVADWDGSYPVRIADGRPSSDCQDVGGEYSAHGPIWSPDGRYLAYRHANCYAPAFQTPGSGWDVVISDAEGNVVTSFPSEGWGISWSPDSTRVAVWVSWPETIGVYGLDGERQSLLTLPFVIPGGESDPVWSPDGRSLFLGKFEIPLDGSTPRPLPWIRVGAGFALSPDGSRVAYTSGKSLVVAGADGSAGVEVLGDGATPGRPGLVNLIWSPTGDRIAFTSQPSRELCVLDVATGTVTVLTKTDGSDILSVLEFWPEGDRILFSRTGQGTGAESLWSVNADGSDPRRLVSGTGWGDWQTLSPTA